MYSVQESRANHLLVELETDDIALEKCKARIEEILGWGDSARWHTQDYATLSARIHQKTGVTLSVATLKRLWGKIKYDSKPTPTTLNTLAQFLDYENWRSFRVSHESNRRAPSPLSTAAPQKRVRHTRVDPILLGIIAGLILLSAAGFGLYRYVRAPRQLDPSLFSFSSKKVVDNGVPNTVVFDYDATAAAPDDSIFVQQSWDRKLSRQVRREQKQHTSIYYYPGFFEAKLVVNRQVVKEHNLLITTNGWLPLIEQPGTPVYFRADDVIHDGVMQLSIDRIKESNVPLQPNPPMTAYYNVREFGNIKSDDMVFETRVRNDYDDGASACQYTEIRLQFEGPVILIPLTAKGCVSNISFGGTDGKQFDFSKFGCDFSKWVDVKCVTKGSLGEIFVDGASAVKFQITGSTAKMVEIGYRFQGTGSVDFIRLGNSSGQVAYSEEF